MSENAVAEPTTELDTVAPEDDHLFTINVTKSGLRRAGVKALKYTGIAAASLLVAGAVASLRSDDEETSSDDGGVRVDSDIDSDISYDE